MVMFECVEQALRKAKLTPKQVRTDTISSLTRRHCAAHARLAAVRSGLQWLLDPQLLEACCTTDAAACRLT